MKRRGLNAALLLISLDFTLKVKGRAEDTCFHSITCGIEHETLITLVPTRGKGLLHHQENTIRDDSVLIGFVTGQSGFPFMRYLSG